MRARPGAVNRGRSGISVLLSIFISRTNHPNTPQGPCIFILGRRHLRETAVRTLLRRESFSAEGGFVSMQAIDGRIEFSPAGNELGFSSEDYS
jgi:hypothetical protein